jgi:hypothetical protein
MSSPSLTEIERLVGLLSDAIDQLESRQAIDPSPTLEDATNTVRFVRDRLARNRVADLGDDASDEGGEIPF